MLAQSSENIASSPLPTGQLCHHFPLDVIKSATQDFNERLILGRGGFGKVYKGTIKNETETVVAIKRLESTSAQGATEFWAEVRMLSMLRHCNLVSLIGYCNDNEEMILVYEYMSNGTLDDHLHKLRTPLSWLQRLKICIGAARALQYLHTGTGTEQGVIHRDVKSSNILLDQKWAAKISDFGLSKISPVDKPSTYVNTLIKGSFGYFDPEYFATGRLTRKSDVFSFGVILLEVLCRRRAVDRSLHEEEWGLVGWAEDSLREGKLKHIIDPDLRGEISLKCLNEYAKIIEGCLPSRAKLRTTMAQVVVGLESILALQERSDSSVPQTGITAFGRKLQKYFFSSDSNSDNSNNGGAPNPCPSTLPNNVNNGGAQERHSRRNRPNPRLNNVWGIPVAGDWPSWLSTVSAEAINGWSPRRADTFEKIDKIGEGRSSILFKGRDALTGKLVALKKLRVDTSNPESVKMMAMEIVILRRLDHPNVIKLQGIVTGRMSHACYLVFDYMEHNFAALVANPDMQFTEPRVRHYMYQLISGLKHCHDHEVLHRDVKLSDLLLDDNRLLLGDTKYGVGVDLWSAGCIMAELLAKRRILDGHTEAEQLQKIYALCGSPPDRFWKTNKLPHKISYKPDQQYKRCITETFKDFPPSSLSLLDTLLSINPAERQSAASALNSEFLTASHDACDPSTLPILSHSVPSTSSLLNHRRSSIPDER